jgi:hypothetical protein
LFYSARWRVIFSYLCGKRDIMLSRGTCSRYIVLLLACQMGVNVIACAAVP